MFAPGFSAADLSGVHALDSGEGGGPCEADEAEGGESVADDDGADGGEEEAAASAAAGRGLASTAALLGVSPRK